MVKRVHWWYNQIPYAPGRCLTNWKILILQSFSHRSDSSNPHVRLPRLGVWHQEEEHPKHLALKAVRPWWQELHGTGGKRSTFFGGHTQVLISTRIQGKKQWLHRSLSRPTLWSWRVSYGCKGRLWLTVGTRTLVVEVLRSTYWCELSWKPQFWHQILAPTSNPKAPVLQLLRPNNHLPLHQKG